MRKIQFWADGYLSYYGWGKYCVRCGGSVFPLQKPEPSLDCKICCGIGGSPLNLAPVAYVDPTVLNRLEDMIHKNISIYGADPKKMSKILNDVEMVLKDNPDAEVAYTITELRKVIEFAADLGTVVTSSEA